MSSRTSLLASALVGALAFTSFDPRAAVAASAKAPQAAPAAAVADLEVSDQRRRRHVRRGIPPAAVIGAFGAIAGAIIAAERRRDYERHYYVEPYAYGPGPYAYGPRPYHYAPGPRYVAPRVYGHPGYRRGGYQGYRVTPRAGGPGTQAPPNDGRL